MRAETHAREWITSLILVSRNIYNSALLFTKTYPNRLSSSSPSSKVSIFMAAFTAVCDMVCIAVNGSDGADIFDSRLPSWWKFKPHSDSTILNSDGKGFGRHFLRPNPSKNNVFSQCITAISQRHLDIIMITIHEWLSERIRYKNVEIKGVVYHFWLPANFTLTHYFQQFHMNICVTVVACMAIVESTLCEHSPPMASRNLKYASDCIEYVTPNPKCPARKRSDLK